MAPSLKPFLDARPPRWDSTLLSTLIVQHSSRETVATWGLGSVLLNPGPQLPGGAVATRSPQVLGPETASAPAVHPAPWGGPGQEFPRGCLSDAHFTEAAWQMRCGRISSSGWPGPSFSGKNI